MTSSWNISHDFAFQLGGAERVTAELGRMFPEAFAYVIAGNRETLQTMGIAGRVKMLAPSFITEKNYRPLAPVHAVMSSFAKPIEGNLIASSYGFAHMFLATGTVVVYSHSPLRQAWSDVAAYSATMPPVVGSAWKYLGAPIIRNIDRKAVRRAHSFIATSRAVQARIRNYYGVAAPIIPPPVDPAFTKPGLQVERGDHYLWVGRIVEPYKKLGLLVEAFRALPDRQLHVVGEGRDRAMIEAAAPPNVHFLGPLETPSLAEAYRSAAALIMPSEDDFGMVAVEAISSGTPVIALAAGGALDTVTEGRSGILYSDSTVAGITKALRDFECTTWDPRSVEICGQTYSASAFQARMSDLLSSIRG